MSKNIKLWMCIVFLLRSLYIRAEIGAKDTMKYSPLEKFQVMNLTYLSGNDNLNNNPNKMSDYKEVSLALNYAYPLGRRQGYLLSAFSYSLISFDQYDEYQALIDNLHYMSIGIGYSKDISNTWKVAGMLSPIIASSSGTKLNNNDWYIRVDAMSSKRLSDNLELGVGISYGKGIDKNSAQYLIPLMSVKYTRRHVSLMGTIPVNIEGLYSWKRYSFGLQAQYLESFYGSIDNELKSFGELQEFKNSRITFGPIFSYGITNEIFCKVNAGMVILSNLKAYDTNQDEAFDLKSNEKILVSVTLQWLK